MATPSVKDMTVEKPVVPVTKETKATKPAVEAKPVKPEIKTVHLHAGLDLIGAKTTVSHKLVDMFELAHGILMVSRKEKRRVVVPYANIRGYELL